jgi:hypothetical protein
LKKQRWTGAASFFVQLKQLDGHFTAIIWYTFERRMLQQAEG